MVGSNGMWERMPYGHSKYTLRDHMPTTIIDAVSTHIKRIDPSLHRICSVIPLLSLGLRKGILDVCQTARHGDEYEAARILALNIVHELNTNHFDIHWRGKEEIHASLRHIAEFPILRSFVSMLVRNEPVGPTGGAEEAMRDGFEKEFAAGQIEREAERRISYQCLDQDNFHPEHYSIYYHPTPAFAGMARNLASQFASRMSKLGILFPMVQRRKNMSQDSCRRLAQDGYGALKDWKELRTVDLEIHAFHTGRRISGDCEMRYGWRYNELKPRFYYCVGASQYWKARWIKHIAIQLMECIPSTTLERRRRPEDIQYSLQMQDWLTIWDMSSFTSTLSELKHFLWYIAKNLEENIFARQHPLRCLDYSLGILEILPHDLLLDYNRDVNENAPFSIWRVLDSLYSFNADPEERFIQKNGGMLGVQGNIGLSTALHGFHIEAAVNKGTGCSVGDDALGGTREDPKKRLIPHLQLIGVIQEAKADILDPVLDDEVQFSKFVKRRLVRDSYGISLWAMYSFPSLADVFQVSDEYHTIRRMEPHERIKKFCTQVSSFFWDLHASAILDSDEYSIINSILGRCYAKLRLRTNGSLPGTPHPDFQKGMMFAVPPLHFDFCRFDWAEYLWDHSNQRYASLPMQYGQISIPPFIPGEVFIVTEGPLVNVLEDIGCLKKGEMLTEWVEVNQTNRRVFRSFLEGQSHTIRCQYLSSCPPWFNDVFESDRRVPMYYGL